MLPRLRVLLLVTVGLLGIAVLAGCGSLPGDAAAKVNDTIITKDDVAGRIESLRKAYGGLVPTEEDGERFNDYRREVTDQLVRLELLEQEAVKRGITVTEQEIDETIAEIADDKFLGDVSKFLEDSEIRGFTVEQVREDYRQQILDGKVKADIGKEITVTDEDARDYYERNKGSYVQPERRQVRQIVTTDEESARQAVSRARAGEDFLTLVSELSVDPEAQTKKGAIGIISPGQLAPELDQAAYAAAIGAVTDPVKLGEQWYVIKVESALAPLNITFEESREEIKALYGSQQFATRWREFVEKVYDDASIEFAQDYDPAFKTETTSTTPVAQAPA